ncbi:hypothetical protein L1987_25172 [Smallanthus sonchifolius]|uniref:Uncharacterized protein n=1 Tax=Smallanthus sonchifolius TaxID=185202 RepID=A0ACB9IQ52_9ASTR|nr:hypothetical protein L1987_25172 [Smallanthus sonchifolius]
MDKTGGVRLNYIVATKNCVAGTGVPQILNCRGILNFTSEGSFQVANVEYVRDTILNSSPLAGYDPQRSLLAEGNAPRSRLSKDWPVVCWAFNTIEVVGSRKPSSINTSLDTRSFNEMSDFPVQPSIINSLSRILDV